jgi:putative membrane-bound dehydrogenase-like protein
MSLRRALILPAVCIFTCFAARALAQQSPQATVAGLTAADGLELKLWASEPVVQKPTNMDIDARGRIWITEGTNYRRVHYSEGGDRILILEDTHHTGVCDSRKVFVQDKRLNAPLGICVLGDKVLVSNSPDILVYTIDSTGDHPTGPPEVLFTGFAGANHDHGVHKCVFGPDGRIYFNSGNEGTRGYIQHDGKPVVDRLGSEVGLGSKIVRGHPKAPGEMGYQDGMAFSCNVDGSDFEVIADNFRNNYELCVDSFGTVWQSDNDDDGNQGTRINYVMEGGDFGYKGPTGTSWDRDRSLFPGQTRQEAHWHSRWPGTVPNLLNTGAGAPTGTVCYEGDLFPPVYRGALIGADAGRNVIRAYITTPSLGVPVGLFNPVTPADVSQVEKAVIPGAGYDAEAIEILKLNDHGDRWFRPSDVCVAPDGSVFICDWYDPGVGGHATGDIKGHLHGRVYRLAPSGFVPPTITLDLSTTSGKIAALSSPNQATRYLGYTALFKDGQSAVPALQELYHSADPRLRARALWLLARTQAGPDFVTAALKDSDPDIRVTALRAARAIKMDMITLADSLITDPSPAVWRELCLAMYFQPTEKALPILVKLAGKYDGKDRWYLEAFGIGCTGREKQVLAAWQQDNPNAESDVARGIAWRLNKVPTPDQEVPEVAKTGETVTHPHVPTTPPPSAAFTLSSTADPKKQFKTRGGGTLPTIQKLMLLPGNPERGADVFRNTKAANCVHCHQIGNDGNMIGPPLTAVGAKLNKGQLYEAILYPSASILMHYESWVVKTKNGDVFNGLLREETNDHITIEDTDGKFHDIKLDDIEKKVMQKISLMPEGLSETMTEKNLVDLVEYLSEQRP